MKVTITSTSKRAEGFTVPGSKAQFSVPAKGSVEVDAEAWDAVATADTASGKAARALLAAHTFRVERGEDDKDEVQALKVKPKTPVPTPDLILPGFDKMTAAEVTKALKDAPAEVLLAHGDREGKRKPKPRQDVMDAIDKLSLA